jgi:hypothetical protein
MRTHNVFFALLADSLAQQRVREYPHVISSWSEPIGGICAALIIVQHHTGSRWVGALGMQSSLSW